MDHQKPELRDKSSQSEIPREKGNAEKAHHPWLHSRPDSGSHEASSQTEAPSLTATPIRIEPDRSSQKSEADHLQERPDKSSSATLPQNIEEMLKLYDRMITNTQTSHHEGKIHKKETERIICSIKKDKAEKIYNNIVANPQHFLRESDQKAISSAFSEINESSNLDKNIKYFMVIYEDIQNYKNHVENTFDKCREFSTRINDWFKTQQSENIVNKTISDKNKHNYEEAYRELLESEAKITSKEGISSWESYQKAIDNYTEKFRQLSKAQFNILKDINPEWYKQIEITRKSIKVHQDSFISTVNEIGKKHINTSNNDKITNELNNTVRTWNERISDISDSLSNAQIRNPDIFDVIEKDQCIKELNDRIKSLKDVIAFEKSRNQIE